MWLHLETLTRHWVWSPLWVTSQRSLAEINVGHYVFQTLITKACRQVIMPSLIVYVSYCKTDLTSKSEVVFGFLRIWADFHIGCSYGSKFFVWFNICNSTSILAYRASQRANLIEMFYIDTSPCQFRVFVKTDEPFPLLSCLFMFKPICLDFILNITKSLCKEALIIREI